jgi:hypothetical protein
VVSLINVKHIEVKEKIMEGSWKKVVLKKDTMFFSGYLGSGIPSKVKVFPAGTKCFYTKTTTRSGIYHSVSINADGFAWEANVRVSFKEDKNA